jgi:DNA-binding transcriptional LysR family regulator
MLRLNDLRNFLEASSCSTFSEAARKLGITQPALSESVKRLESDLGRVLFYRAKAGISLTPEGRGAVSRAKGVLGQLGELELSPQTGAAPAVTIGCHPVVGSYTLPEALKRLQKSQPGARVELRHGLSREMQDEIQKGRIDVGVVINPVPNPDLVIRVAARDVVGVWSSRKPLEQVICEPELVQTQAILRAWKKRPQELLASSSLELIARLAHSGLGYGILPERVVKLTGLALERVPGTPSYEDRICVVSRPEFGGTRYERQVLDSLMGVLK